MGQAQITITRIISILKERYRKNPKSLRRFSPEIFALIESLCPYQAQKSKGSLFSCGGVTPEQARAGLEEFLGGKDIDLYNLLRYLGCIAYMNKRDVVFYSAVEKLMSQLWPKGLPNRKTRKAIRKGKVKGEDAVVSLILGLGVGVTTGWDIYWIEFDPQKYGRWKGGLSIIGIGHDPDPDASTRHDELLYGRSK